MIADSKPIAKAPQATAESIRMIESAEIFRGQSEILITHQGLVYRLKITRQGKLILNK
jgi:hemin uptake protein HemP